MRSRATRSSSIPRKNFQASRQAGLSRPDRAEGTGRHGREPRRRRDGGGNHRALRLPVDRHVLHHASGRGRRRAACAITTIEPIAGHHARGSTRTAWSARCPIPIPRPARISGIRSRPVPRRSATAGRSARRHPGPRPAASPIGTSSRRPAPNFDGNYSDLSCFLIMGNEVKADPSNWDGLGLRGNQSGPIEVDDAIVPKDRLVGPDGRWRLLQRRMRRSLLPPVLVGLLERHLDGLIDIAKAPHHQQDPQGRRHARRRLSDHPGLCRRGDHRHQRLPCLRLP